MKHLILITMLMFSTPASAGQEEYDDCILEHLKGAKLDFATHLIRQACQENYKSPNFTSKKKFAYNQCLLENLVGIESFQAVIEIKSACDSKHN